MNENPCPKSAHDVAHAAGLAAYQAAHEAARHGELDSVWQAAYDETYQLILGASRANIDEDDHRARFAIMTAAEESAATAVDAQVWTSAAAAHETYSMAYRQRYEEEKNKMAGRHAEGYAVVQRTATVAAMRAANEAYQAAIAMAYATAYIAALAAHESSAGYEEPPQVSDEPVVPK